MRNTEMLRKLTFFSELQESDLQQIADISVERSYRKNMIIFMENEPGEAFYYVKSGKVKVFRTSEGGKEHTIHILGEGDIFGEVTLFNSMAYPASALAYEDSVVGIIRNKNLEDLVKSNSELALKLIKLLARKLIFAQEKIKDLTFNDVFSRTASQILKLARDYGTHTEKGIIINIQLSRQELADMVGTTRETVSRAINRFKREKSITEQKDKIIIINKEKLLKTTIPPRGGNC